MYFKIEDKESETYKRVMDYITLRRNTKTENCKKVEEYTGVKFNEWIGNSHVFCRVFTIDGIKPIQKGTQIEGWKPSPNFPDALIPNRRTKKGREAENFLNNLPNWTYKKELDLLNLKDKPMRFYAPYIEELDGIIALNIDDRHNPIETIDMIEITTTEFKRITKQ